MSLYIDKLSLMESFFDKLISFKVVNKDYKCYNYNRKKGWCMYGFNIYMECSKKYTRYSYYMDSVLLYIKKC